MYVDVAIVALGLEALKQYDSQADHRAEHQCGEGKNRPGWRGFVIRFRLDETKAKFRLTQLRVAEDIMSHINLTSEAYLEVAKSQARIDALSNVKRPGMGGTQYGFFLISRIGFYF